MSAPSIDRSYYAEDGDYESTGTLLDYPEEHPMTDETYNGWKNYPTWAVNLWLSNDEGLYAVVTEMAQGTRIDLASPIRLADEIRDFVRDDLAPDLGASFAADLLGYALDQVDWLEIADAWLDQ